MVRTWRLFNGKPAIEANACGSLFSFVSFIDEEVGLRIDGSCGVVAVCQVWEQVSKSSLRDVEGVTYLCL
jgi:hypothetical protein